MPYTFAHPAAVLPLRRTPLVFSALVIGSMAPDFEYFFGLASPASHSMPGILTFTFPIALAVLVVFHSLLKWPLIALLPSSLQARVAGPARRFRWFPATRFLMILLSLAVGIATHIFFDDFTHAHGWAVVRFAVLRTMVPVPAHLPMPVFSVLQYGATAVGVLLLAISFFGWYRRARTEDIVQRPQFSAAVKLAILSAMILTALVLSYMNAEAWYGQLFSGASQRVRFITGFAISITTVAAVELIGFSLLWRSLLFGKQPVPESKGSDHKRLNENRG